MSDLADHSPYRGSVLKLFAAADFAQSQSAQSCILGIGPARLTFDLPDCEFLSRLRHDLCPCCGLGFFLHARAALLHDFLHALATTLGDVPRTLLLLERVERRPNHIVRIRSPEALGDDIA